MALWARFHGLLTLELRGDLPQMLDDPGALFEAELERVLAELAG
ncbi:MAG TPA: WHG domain-containing protein [Pseudonocardia sp.]